MQKSRPTIWKHLNERTNIEELILNNHNYRDTLCHSCFLCLAVHLMISQCAIQTTGLILLLLAFIKVHTHILLRTFNRVEKVEKGVIGHLFGDDPRCPSAFVLLFLLDRFYRHIFAFVPINFTPAKRRDE